ncbi:hypothetical protein [Pontibacter cellulosilyticus]|uniref:STAS/SEC14 domain-containing protein n=1 Tax=Pontibacter cellulosilyticus TaxID=1720253 RepID=A0A923N6H3_9BACT|nr:hypothetical protein [Pontibacter cellulosilyticus]MBC5991385.1 hypothetical protein [Pontibacter cellulosilyticus]
MTLIGENMFIYFSDSMQVSCDRGKGLLVLTCLKRLRADEFKEGMVRALWYAEKYNIKRWLFDIKLIGALNEEEEAWLQNCLYPKMMSSLGADNYIAFLLSESCYKQLLFEAGETGLKTYNSFIILSMFDTTAKALEWLAMDSVATANI